MTISKKKYKTQKNRLDKLWSQIIRNKYDNTCVVCGKSKKKGDVIQAHHCIVTKAHGNSTRWDTDNGVALCYGCHIGKLHGSSDKEFLDKYLSIVNALISYETQQEVIQRSNCVLKDSELDAVESKLKSML